MDFSKQLENLQKTAANAASRNTQSSSFQQHRQQPSSQNHRGGGRHYNNNHRRRGGGRQYHPYGRGGGGGNRSNDEEYYLLQRLISKIPKYQPVNVPKKEKRPHIALLFLTIDDLPLEHIWRGWLQSSKGINDNDDDDENLPLVSIICHAKYPERVTSTWLQQRLLVQKRSSRQRNQQHQQEEVRYHTRRPEWGSIDITRAMIDLLDEGLKIGSPRHDNQSNFRYSTRRYLSTTTTTTNTTNSTTPLDSIDRFIFVSETCMPVCTLQELHSALYNQNDANKSWLKVSNSPNNGYARQLQWDRVTKCISQDKIWKADQWICLTRHHAWPIVSLVEEASQNVLQQSTNKNHHSSRNNHNNNHHHRNNHGAMIKPALWQCFKHVKASDEIYFPTAMSLLGILQNNDNNEQNNEHEEIATRRITYCDWSMNAKNPASFLLSKKDDFQQLKEVFQLARAEGCLFARKFIVNYRQEQHHSSTFIPPQQRESTTKKENDEDLESKKQQEVQDQREDDGVLSFENWMKIMNQSNTALNTNS